MHIRSLQVDHHRSATELLIQAFGPFFDGYARPLLGEPIYQHQHGHWNRTIATRSRHSTTPAPAPAPRERSDRRRQPAERVGVVEV